ncbi:MAG: hypothetical protein ACKOXO_12060, partial [Cyanobium sp.]
MTILRQAILPGAIREQAIATQTDAARALARCDQRQQRLNASLHQRAAALAWARPGLPALLQACRTRFPQALKQPAAIL